jgi:antirestriction protein
VNKIMVGNKKYPNMQRSDQLHRSMLRRSATITVGASMAPGSTPLRSRTSFTKEVSRMLARSTMPGAEEFAIHDYEGFGPLRLSEYESLETVALIARGIHEHGPAFAHWAALVGTNEPDVLAEFEDHYEGHAESVEAYAEQLLDDMGFGSDFDLAGQLPASLQPYVRFDVEGFARDLELSGDIMTSEGDGGIYVFRPL